MKSSTSFVKVRYAETDQMGVVHHGNYAQYFEIARIDWLEQFDVSYRSLEESGVMLPVYEMGTKFLKPAYFDDELEIVTHLKAIPNIKIEFEYEVFNSSKELLTKASTTLVFMDAKTRKPIACPDFILKKLKD